MRLRLRPRTTDYRLQVVIAVALFTASARGDEAAPPWSDPGDVPVPAWARSVAATKSDAALYAEPGKVEERRGSVALGARLPFFGTRRAANCTGRWMNVGPLAWICSDVAEWTGDEPGAALLGTSPWQALQPTRQGTRGLPPIEPASKTDDGLPYRYYFAGEGGAYGFANLANALDDAPDQDLDKGFAVAAVEEKTAHGEQWIRSKKGRWIATRELVPARSFLFHGELVTDKLDVAWIVAEKANVYSDASAAHANGTRVRFEHVHVAEVNEKTGMARVTDEHGGWMRTRDLAMARLSAPPPEAATGERWIDVDLAQQTLVAYEGEKPVFATIVSTGRGPKGTDAATPPGAHRIWVKIFTSKMDNLDKDDVEHHYAIEDVPWVQFFDKAVALHGAFWHRDFGHVHSHGCVNLAPLDARWLFAFTAPMLPRGWTASFPTKIEQGTLVRVR